MKKVFYNFKAEYTKGSIVNKLTYINIIVFVVINIIALFGYMFQTDISLFVRKLYLPASLTTLINQPWSLITYMFLHSGLLHLFFNLIWLHFGGKLFLQYLNSKQLLTTYVFGGISGGLFFILLYNYIPVFKPFAVNALAVGSSASVYAIMIAVATYAPNYTVQIPFLGLIRLKYIAIFMITMDILSIPKENAGGHIAHIGGAIFGYFYIYQIRKGRDISDNFSSFLQKLSNTFKPKSNLKTVHRRPKTDYEYNSNKSRVQKEVDEILEKIANSGYDSLSKEEKALLFKASKK